MDLSNLSDSDLEAISRGDMTKVSDEGLAHLSSGPTLGQKALGVAGAIASGIGAVGRGIDSVGGAPVRAAISAAQDGNNPIDAYKAQFAANPDAAPTGKDIVHKTHVLSDQPFSQASRDVLSAEFPVTSALIGLLPESVQAKVRSISPEDIGGAAMSLMADPINVVPLAGEAAKGIGGLSRAADVAGIAADAAKSPVGRVVGKGLDLAGTGLAKTGELITGVPEQEIKTYAAHADEINQMLKESGGSHPELADTIRSGFQKDIAAKRQALGAQVGKALDSASPEKSISAQPILDRLGEVHARIDPNIDPGNAQQIEALADKISSVADEHGNVSPSDLFNIKELLDDRGKRAFMQDGQMFQPGTKAQLASKLGASQARRMLNSAVPELTEANNQLAMLHKIEDKINPNLIAPGNSDAALATAGGGTNARNTMMLQRLGGATGTDMVGDAQKFAAAKRFGNPSLSPVDATGKSMLRTGIGSALGWLAGGHSTMGAMIGAATASPAALKLAIQTGRIPIDAVKMLAGTAGALTDESLAKAFSVLKTPEGASFLNQYLSSSPMTADNGMGAVQRRAASQNSQQ